MCDNDLIFGIVSLIVILICFCGWLGRKYETEELKCEVESLKKQIERLKKRKVKKNGSKKER